LFFFLFFFFTITYVGNLSDKGELFRISQADFWCAAPFSLVLSFHFIDSHPVSFASAHHGVGGPKPLTARDTVVVFEPGSLENTAVAALLLSAPSRVVGVRFGPAVPGSALTARCEAVVALPSPDTLELFPEAGLLRTFMLKLVCNVISTGANVLKGVVLGNAMINLTLSNNKLFQRSVEIVARVAALPEQQAVDCLLRSIYRVDNVPLGICEKPLSAHIEVLREFRWNNMCFQPPLTTAWTGGNDHAHGDPRRHLTGQRVADGSRAGRCQRRRRPQSHKRPLTGPELI
jgi:hypothetical protein